MKTNLALRADGSETIAYDYADHFVFTGRDKLSNYHNLSCGLHWHEELELIRILSGTMLLNVSGTVYRIKEGEGALINSNRFHSLFSKGQADCEFHCAILSPACSAAPIGWSGSSCFRSQRHVRRTSFP